MQIALELGDPVVPVRDVSDPEFIWACGFFEGEGSILYKPREASRRMKRRLSLGNTDLESIERFHLAVRVGTLNGPHKRRPAAHSDMWYWACNRWVDLEPLLRDMLPWLSERRLEKAAALLADPPLVGRLQ